MSGDDGFSVSDPLAPPSEKVTEEAEARARILRAESRTPVGLMEAAIRQYKELLADARAEREKILTEARKLLADAVAERDQLLATTREQAKQIMDHAKEYAAAVQETADRQRSEMRAVSVATSALVDVEVQTMERLRTVHELLSAPKERTPTVSEVMGQSFNNFTTEIKNLIQFAVQREPLLLRAGAFRLGGPDAMLKASAASAPTSAPAAGPAAAGTRQAPNPAAPAEATNGASNVSVANVKPMLEDLGDEYAQAFLERNRITSYQDLTFGHIQQLFADWSKWKADKARAEERAANGAPSTS